MVRAPWNRETQGGLAIIIGPTADPGAQIVCSSSAADGRRPEREARLPRPPHLSRPHRHAGFNRTASRTCPSRHDARIEHGSCSDRNSKARERPHQTDKVAAAGYDSAGLPGPAETAGGDAASRVHAVALITIAPITRPACRFELLTPRFVVRIPSHRRASVQGTSERRKYFCYSPLG